MAMAFSPADLYLRGDEQIVSADVFVFGRRLLEPVLRQVAPQMFEPFAQLIRVRQVGEGRNIRPHPLVKIEMGLVLAAVKEHVDRLRGIQCSFCVQVRKPARRSEISTVFQSGIVSAASAIISGK
jgi:hypothetical protein